MDIDWRLICIRQDLVPSVCHNRKVYQQRHLLHTCEILLLLLVYHAFNERLCNFYHVEQYCLLLLLFHHHLIAWAVPSPIPPSGHLIQVAWINCDHQGTFQSAVRAADGEENNWITQLTRRRYHLLPLANSGPSRIGLSDNKHWQTVSGSRISESVIESKHHNERRLSAWRRIPVPMYPDHHYKVALTRSQNGRAHDVIWFRNSWRNRSRPLEDTIQFQGHGNLCDQDNAAWTRHASRSQAGRQNTPMQRPRFYSGDSRESCEIY